jgi:hypothetical protein
MTGQGQIALIAIGIGNNGAEHKRASIIAKVEPRLYDTKAPQLLQFLVEVRCLV